MAFKTTVFIGLISFVYVAFGTYNISNILKCNETELIPDYDDDMPCILPNGTIIFDDDNLDTDTDNDTDTDIDYDFDDNNDLNDTDTDDDEPFGDDDINEMENRTALYRLQYLKLHRNISEIPPCDIVEELDGDLDDGPCVLANGTIVPGEEDEEEEEAEEPEEPEEPDNEIEVETETEVNGEIIENEWEFENGTNETRVGYKQHRINNGDYTIIGSEQLNKDNNKSKPYELAIIMAVLLFIFIVLVISVICGYKYIRNKTEFDHHSNLIQNHINSPKYGANTDMIMDIH